MRAPSWEASVGALAAFLNSVTQCYMVDLFAISMTGGSVVRYTSADMPVTINGNTFATGPVIKRGGTKLSVGIAVDSLSVALSGDTSVTINGVPLLRFIAAGGFDGARLSLERAFSAEPGAAWVGMLPLFQGRLSADTVSRYEANLAVSSDVELLNTMVPRNVYQPGCGKTLFDNACGLSKAAFAVAAAATSATDSIRTTFSKAAGQVDDYFSLGWAVGVSGANAGVGRTIKQYLATGAITAIQPWPAAVAIGDTFTLYPGCDKTQATCNTKFSNLVRFRGFPYIPAPETVT